MCFRIRRRKLPHWDIPGAAYFITACLEGSIPARGLLRLREYEIELSQRPRPDSVPEEDWRERNYKLLFARTDEFLDSEPAVMHLRDSRLAEQVQKSLYHFAGERYDLIAFVVMASHFHWLFRPAKPYEAEVSQRGDGKTPRELIMHSIASYTANECNKLLGRSGAFGEDESYDHCPRDGGEVVRIVEYIEMNPVKAGLVSRPEEWEFSSAPVRKRLRLKPGAPLPKP